MVDQTKISSFAAASRQWTANEQNILRNLAADKATMIPWRAGIASIPAQVAQTTPTSIFTAQTPAPVVTTPAVVTTAVAQAPIQQSTSKVEELYHAVYNKGTGKYDIKQGNKIVKKGVYSKSLAKKYVDKKNAPITASLRQSAPLGNIGGQGSPVTQTVATPTSTVAQKVTTKAASTPVLPKSATQTAKAVSKLGKAHAQPAKPPVTYASFIKEHGFDPRTGKKVAQNADDVIAANHAYKNALEKHLATPTSFSPEKLEQYAGINTKVPTAAEHSNRLKDLEAAFGKADDVVKPAPVVDKIDDVQKVTNGFNWKKLGKYAGIAAVAGLLVGAGILIGKAIQKNKAEKAEEVEPTPVVPVPVPENEEENVTPVDPTPVNPNPVDPTPVVPTPEPTEPNLPLDENGAYTTKKGDCFWNIAKKHLEDKFKDQPEKFANLSEQEKNAKIQLETRRIMKLNGYTMAEDKWHSAPTLHPNVKIQITEKVDLAA